MYRPDETVLILEQAKQYTQKIEIDLSESMVESEGAINFLFVGEGETFFSVTCYEDFEVDGLTIKRGTYLSKFNNASTFYVSCLELETIHPIPQEYIPPLDRLILNGTDGKRYKLFVDESGQLVTTEVTA